MDSSEVTLDIRPAARRTHAGRPPRNSTFVIVGAGQAGVQAAITLRERGFEGRIVLLGSEQQAPYMRPPLSKKFLTGEMSQDRLYLRPDAFYESSDIELRTGIEVESIDRTAQVVRLGNGERQPYDKLLLATGTRARELPVAGARHHDVRYLRSFDDAQALRPRLVAGSRLVVIGGGYVGLEVAATAAQAGLQVTVLEAGPRLLSRVTGPSLSDYLAQEHRRHGVDVRCNVRVTGLRFSQNRLQGVHSEQSCVKTCVDADLAVVGIGAVANDELAQTAGLLCDGGIEVDDHCRTSDPDIFAAGDCTRHPNAIFGRRVRLESVQNAVDQASIAAINMMGGSAVYARVPWFWSHQYGLKLQSAGLSTDHDRVEERGDRGAGRFALLYFRGPQLLAVDAVNMPGEYLGARKIIALRGEVTIPTAAAAPTATAAATTH